MTTKLTYRMIQSDGDYVAKCEELAIESTGASPEAALDALKKAAESRLSSVEAVGPPSRLCPAPRIDLVPAIAEEPEPQGPGDSPAADQTREPGRGPR
jgi:hypothetical protein